MAREFTCLVGRFYGHLSRISNKVYSEPLMHDLSPCKGLIENFQILFMSTWPSVTSFFLSYCLKVLELYFMDPSLCLQLSWKYE